jgi:transposase
MFLNQEEPIEAYRQELRKKIITARTNGQSAAEVARRYHVTVRTVERYWKRYQETAQIGPKRQGGYRVSKLAAHDPTILAWIADKPGWTLAQLQQRCAQQLEVSISVHALWYRLERLGLSFKKNDARGRTRSA